MRRFRRPRYDDRAEVAAIVTTLILTQGRLAEELLAAARQIAGGDCERLAALALDWDDSLETARDKLARTVASLPHEDGLLILTDIFGGTPSNLALELRKPGEVEVVSGVNLPMVVRLGCGGSRPKLPLAELADWIRSRAQAGICRGEGRRTESHGGA